MKVFLTSIGEKTTQISKAQLERFGFTVVLLDVYESWFDKYCRFLKEATEPCLRMDADVIPNKRILDFAKAFNGSSWLMGQAMVYDLYSNDTHAAGPIYYSKTALKIIKDHLKELDKTKPETSAWRLKEINGSTFTFHYVVGFHGFFQEVSDLQRGIENKLSKLHMNQEDVELVEKLHTL